MSQSALTRVGGQSRISNCLLVTFTHLNDYFCKRLNQQALEEHKKTLVLQSSAIHSDAVITFLLSLGRETDYLDREGVAVLCAVDL